MMNKISIFIGLISIIMVFSCSRNKEIYSENILSDQEIIPPNRLSGGASGMTRMDDHTFIGIYDLKSFADGPRVVKITTSLNEPIKIIPIIIDSWVDDEGKPSDLESICRIGDSGNEFLMAEAGTWQNGYGRLFHLSIDTITNSGVIEGVVKLPFLHTNDFDLVGDQYEGIACIKRNENEVTVILAERGGSEIFQNGILRWGNLNLNDYALNFSNKGMKGITIDAPGNWLNPKSKRDITALHIGDDKTLWASASQDIGDSGPFYSVIYQLGKVTEDHSNPIELYDQFTVWREVSGYKIEALSGPSSLVPGSVISFATEDEAFGGNWRAIK